MPLEPVTTTLTRCASCNAEIGPRILVCPGCHRLVHADELRTLATEAQRHQDENRPADALGAWRRALDLLPPETRQHQQILETVNALSKVVDAQPLTVGLGSATTTKPHHGNAGRGAAVAGGLGVLAVAASKIKYVGLFMLGSGKALVGGLGKSTTLLSMLAAFGVYWTVFGWWFALGLVLLIYVHEMGHVVALRRFGIRATAPMFIPGVGALVRLNQHPANPVEDARVGLAGPIWGTAGAAITLLIHVITGNAAWAAVASSAALLNMFNMLPVWQLDGGRGFQSLTRTQRWIASGACVVMWLMVPNGWLLAIAGFGAWKAMQGGSAEPDWKGLWTFVLLIIAQCAVATGGAVLLGGSGVDGAAANP